MAIERAVAKGGDEVRVPVQMGIDDTLGTGCGAAGEDDGGRVFIGDELLHMRSVQPGHRRVERRIHCPLVPQAFHHRPFVIELPFEDRRGQDRLGLNLVEDEIDVVRREHQVDRHQRRTNPRAAEECRHVLWRIQPQNGHWISTPDPRL